MRPAQLLEGAPAVGMPAGSSITSADAQRLLPVALQQWQAAGIDPVILQTLQATEIRIDDFAGDGLAWAMQGVISLDRDAAGYGWFVDATPNDHSEFLTGSGHGAANGQVDFADGDHA